MPRARSRDDETPERGESGARSDDEAPLRELLDAAGEQAHLLSDIRAGIGLATCTLDQMARIVCVIANEVHRESRQLTGIDESVRALLELYKSAHPDQALQLERLAQLQAELRACCPPADEPVDRVCVYEPCEPSGGFRPGDGYSVKSRGTVEAVETSDRPHEAWRITRGVLNANQTFPPVPQGQLVGRLEPAPATPAPLDFRSGQAPSGSQQPVTFRTYTTSGVTTGVWPPDMSGAKGGDVVVMSGNLWLKLSVDGGKTFTDLDFTKVFKAETTYGGWAGDQVIHYVPAIDCFVLYVQSRPGSPPNATKSVVKVALASPADLKKYSGAKAAWRRQWHFTSDDFGLNSWLDFPDVSYGTGYLYLNTNTFNRQLDASGKPVLDSKGNPQDTYTGKLFLELPLNELKAGGSVTYQYGLVPGTGISGTGSPTQNIGDENYWAAHVDNSTMRIYSSKGSETTYSWRERKLKANWPQTTDNNIVGTAPDSSDWISEDHRIIGATRVGNHLWFAWTAKSGNGGAGGFSFPQPHIQIATFDLTQDYACIGQTQVWNADHAYAYASLTTNSDSDVGISVAWGGGQYYGSHAVGILGDFVVWYGEASQRTSARTSPTRFGDYLHVRLAHPDTRFFSAFGYSVRNATPPSSGEQDDYLYVEFGREAIAPGGLH